MSNYLISYDLLKPVRDYSKLHEAIRAIDANAWHGLESVWLISASAGAQAIRNYLSTFIDSNDRLLVIGLTREWAGLNLPNVDGLLAATNTVLVA